MPKIRENFTNRVIIAWQRREWLIKSSFLSKRKQFDFVNWFMRVNKFLDNFFKHLSDVICSPDKTDTCSISNPKVNRILNNIAIRAISSFLFRIFTINFCTFVYTHTASCFYFFWNNMKSEILLIWTTLLQFFRNEEIQPKEWISLFRKHENLRLLLS